MLPLIMVQLVDHLGIQGGTDYPMLSHEFMHGLQA